MIEDDGEVVLLAMCIVCTVLAFFHLFYNNLLINLRFLCKMRCVTLGLCMYDCVNIAFCHCILLKPCRDRCFTIWTMIKWAIYGVIMGVTIHLVKNYETRIQEQNFEAGRLEFNDESFKSNLDLYLILFLLQHPVFMVARIPIFFLYTLLTCCCDKGVDHNDNEQFKNAVIHFDFIPFELGQLNNFENHLVGRNELQYMRRLSLVRGVSIRER